MNFILIIIMVVNGQLSFDHSGYETTEACFDARNRISSEFNQTMDRYVSTGSIRGSCVVAELDDGGHESTLTIMGISGIGFDSIQIPFGSHLACQQVMGTMFTDTNDFLLAAGVAGGTSRMFCTEASSYELLVADDEDEDEDEDHHDHGDNDIVEMQPITSLM